MIAWVVDLVWTNQKRLKVSKQWKKWSLSKNEFAASTSYINGVQNMKLKSTDNYVLHLKNLAFKIFTSIRLKKISTNESKNANWWGSEQMQDHCNQSWRENGYVDNAKDKPIRLLFFQVISALLREKWEEILTGPASNLFTSINVDCRLIYFYVRLTALYVFAVLESVQDSPKEETEKLGWRIVTWVF